MRNQIEKFRQWLAWLLYGWACWLARELMGPNPDPDIVLLRDQYENAKIAAQLWRARYETLLEQKERVRAPRTVVF